jgi:hypothetical protein
MPTGSGADDLSRDQTLVGMRRRHADVDDGDVSRRPVIAKVRSVSNLPGDLDTGIVEQACEPRRSSAESSAITTRMESLREPVPAPGRSSTNKRPSSADPVDEAAKSRAGVETSPADAVVLDLDRHAPGTAHDGDLPLVPACFATFASASATTKYTAVSTCGEVAGGRSPDGIGARSASVRTAASSPGREDRGDAASEPRSSHALSASACLVDERCRFLVSVYSSEQPKSHADPEQTLLSTIVEIPLEPSTSPPSEARCLIAQLSELHPKLARSCRSRAQVVPPSLQPQAAVADHEHNMDHRREPCSHGGHSTVRPAGKRDLTPALVRPHAAIRKPERQLERRVADRPGERIAHASGLDSVELDDEIADRAARLPNESHSDQGSQGGHECAGGSTNRSAKGTPSDERSHPDDLLLLRRRRFELVMEHPL